MHDVFLGPWPSALWQHFGSVYAVPLFVGEAYMPPGRSKRSRGVRGGNDRIRRTDNFLNFYCAAGVNTRPTIQNKHQTDPATADARTVLRAACMPPLRIDQTPSRPKKRHGKTSVAGRMHAAPTDRGKHTANHKNLRGANGRGGVCARRRVSYWRRSAVSERNRAARPGS